MESEPEDFDLSKIRLPCWARYVGIDCDGKAVAFQERPTFRGGIWWRKNAQELHEDLDIPVPEDDIACLYKADGTLVEDALAWVLNSHALYNPKTDKHYRVHGLVRSTLQVKCIDVKNRSVNETLNVSDLMIVKIRPANRKYKRLEDLVGTVVSYLSGTYLITYCEPGWGAFGVGNMYVPFIDALWHLSSLDGKPLLEASYHKPYEEEPKSFLERLFNVKIEGPLKIDKTGEYCERST